MVTPHTPQQPTPNNQSDTVHRRLNLYIDQLSSAFLLVTAHRVAHQPLPQHAITQPELAGYLDPTPEYMELWEQGDYPTLGKIIVYQLTQYYQNTIGKQPTHPPYYYQQKWEHNIQKGLKSLGIKITPPTPPQTQP